VRRHRGRGNRGSDEKAIFTADAETQRKANKWVEKGGCGAVPVAFESAEEAEGAEITTKRL
jgi:hypothetical protein